MLFLNGINNYSKTFSIEEYKMFKKISIKLAVIIIIVFSSSIGICQTLQEDFETDPSTNWTLETGVSWSKDEKRSPVNSVKFATESAQLISKSSYNISQFSFYAYRSNNGCQNCVLQVSFDGGNNWENFTGLGRNFTLITPSIASGTYIIRFRKKWVQSSCACILYLDDIYNDSPLPVKLSSFVSSVNLNKVTISWTTSGEVNNAGFKVERVKLNQESITWSGIGFIQGSGTTNETRHYTYVDRCLNSGNYNYRLKQIDYNGNSEYFKLQNDVSVGVPEKFNISQNYPNPSNPSSRVNYTLPFDAKVEITIYDVMGREINKIIDGEKTAGYYTAILNGAGLTSGIYFYRIIAEGKDKVLSKTMKMLIIK